MAIATEYALEGSRRYREREERKSKRTALPLLRVRFYKKDVIPLPEYSCKLGIHFWRYSHT